MPSLLSKFQCYSLIILFTFLFISVILAVPVTCLLYAYIQLYVKRQVSFKENIMQGTIKT